MSKEIAISYVTPADLLITTTEPPTNVIVSRENFMKFFSVYPVDGRREYEYIIIFTTHVAVCNK